MTQEKALVLFSGGQDSATCLAWALDRFAQVETIGFDYLKSAMPFALPCSQPALNGKRNLARII